MGKIPPLKRAICVAALALSTFLSIERLQSEEKLPSALSSSGVIEGLARPGGIIRSGEVAFPQMQGRDADFVRNLSLDNISSQQRRDLDILIVQFDLPRIEVEVHFEFGSDVPLNQSLQLIRSIAVALNSPELAGSRILIAGHTDAVGSAASNQRLSERRAKMVRRILIEHYSVAPSMLMAAGFGAERLKDVNNPASAVNRRVEFVNLGRIQ